MMVARAALGPQLRRRIELSDVVQETFVEVVRRFPQFAGQSEAELLGWMRRLVGQRAVDLGRYHQRAKRSPAAELSLDAVIGPGGDGRSRGSPSTRPAPARRPAIAS